jgi:hypothetical protein
MCCLGLEASRIAVAGFLVVELKRASCCGYVE